jgi:predicted metal-dependent hydrolase
MTMFFMKRPAARPAPPRAEVYAVEGRTLPLKIVEHARATRLTLRLDSAAGGLRVTVPPGVRPAEVDRFLARHQGWIAARLAKLPDRPKIRPGVRIPLKGVPHLIAHEPGRRGTVVRAEASEGPMLVVHGERVHLPRRLSDFLKKEARGHIEPLAHRHADAIGRKIKMIRFKDTRSRWGSCTADGVLSFSWRIAMAPPAVIDYLVAHEVAHLAEMNHGPQFWKLCKELCPDTPRCKDWLKRNGAALQAMEFGN